MAQLNMKTRPSEKRGVVLLVVLSLLVLFVLIAMMAILVSGQFKRASFFAGKQDQLGNDPQEELEQVLYQLIRDTRVRSSLQGHSLLNDLYGNDGIMGEIASTTSSSSYTNGGQYLRLNFNVGTVGNDPAFSATLEAAEDYYNGRVLTMLEGRAANLSTRIIKYLGHNGTTGSMLVMPFDFQYTFENPSDRLTLQNDGEIRLGDKFLINGAPFNGTGSGFDPANQNTALKTTLTDGSNIAYALMPHFIAYASGLENRSNGIDNIINQGGADESYDAVDFQNLFLAMVPPLATNSSQIIPSFHRPYLIEYHQANGNWTDNADLQRRVMLRPNPVDHPNFPTIDPVNGPWDVDNDGDGIADSVWVDVGLPVKASASGRLYEPLAAILIKDLDGRLNLNAHGNAYHLQAAYTNDVTASLAGGVSSAALPKGKGMGLLKFIWVACSVLLTTPN